MQLRFTSFVVINLRRDFHPQECAHAGRTHEKRRSIDRRFCFRTLDLQAGLRHPAP
jgi:hypothetical protein